MKIALCFYIAMSFVECLKNAPREDFIMKTYNENSSVLLGGFFGVHQRGNATTECGKIDAESGVYLVEAMKWAISRHKTEVPIGYRIYDTCSSIKRLHLQLYDLPFKYNFMGIVGPPTSNEAVLASAGLSLFPRPVISYSATSIELNDRDKFWNFFRTIPADDIQARVLLDILKRYKWKYISLVNSHGTYGQQGMNRLVKLLDKEKICISAKTVLPKNPKRGDFEKVIKELELRNPENSLIARTVVLFTTSEDTYGLFQAARSKTKFQWISSSAWDANFETVRGVKEVAKGAILLNYENINNKKFMQHFKSLTLNENRYSWFEEFWEQQFNCKVKTTANSTGKLCTGNENLHDSQFYAKYAASNAVIDAVDAYADALSCAIRQECKQYLKCANVTECLQTCKINYHRVGYLTTNCIAEFGFQFHKYAGDQYRNYDIINFDGNAYKTVGIWKINHTSYNPGILEINDTSITWYKNGSQIPQSVCSKPCKPGERRIVSKTKECCFKCQACRKNEILQNNKCIACHKLSTSSKDSTKCEKLPKFHIPIDHPLSILILAGSTIGLVLNTISLVLFIKYFNSNVIKASSRELSIFMLGGLYLCFLSPYTFLLDATTVRCGLRRIIFGISLTACYTPLVLKTNRIYRIFKSTRTLASVPQFVSPTSQILICFGLLALQTLMYVMWVVGDPPIIKHIEVEQSGTMVADICGDNVFTLCVNIIPCCTMLAISTVYAFKSRKFHKNVNEVSNISVTMYVSCALWALLIPLLFWVKVQSKNPFGEIFVIANFSNVIGLVFLLGLFGPKVYNLMKFKGNEKHNDGNTLEKSIEFREVIAIDDIAVESDAENE
eukprot:Seg842.1 transcript_id=Seg842.1/GoldUCD/mRNA.D3Y31 product="Metabotropic glutamate receptor 4" protein_id=Seg842.1/GoldUCD/D3Y31